jgi:alkylated DNA repair protein alkB family protein 6
MISASNPLSEFELSGNLPVPKASYYIPDFISTVEEAQLLDRIHNHTPKTRWVNMRNRRLQEWGARPLNSNKALHEPLPDFMSPLLKKLETLDFKFRKDLTAEKGDEELILFKPNQCLLNECVVLP